MRPPRQGGADNPRSQRMAAELAHPTVIAGRGRHRPPTRACAVDRAAFQAFTPISPWRVISFRMGNYIALLRAVNVGGTGRLAMDDLAAMCSDAGFAQVQTYIASGNVVFQCKATPKKVKFELEARLHAYAGRPVGVVVRTAKELAAVLQANPFPKAARNRTVAIFLDAPPPPDALAHAVGLQAEEMRLGVREIYVHYAAGMGRSKLKIPVAKNGTARNMNTIAALVLMAAKSSMP
jgi:uncharacterized protein (DUF1697 family)